MRIRRDFRGYAGGKGPALAAQLVALEAVAAAARAAAPAAPSAPAAPRATEVLPVPVPVETEKAEEPKDESATLYFYDLIGYDWWTGGGITAKKVLADLEALKDEPEIHVRINSPGGDVFEGIAIYNALVRFKGRVIVHVDALAASIASLVAMAGDEIRAAENAEVMVHFPWTFTAGDEDAHRSMAEKLLKCWASMGATYARRTGMTTAAIAKEIRRDADREWWMTAKEAKAAGFVDEITTPEDVKALHDPRLSFRGRAGGGSPEPADLAPPRVARAPAAAPEDGEKAAARRRRQAEVAELET